MSFAAYVVIYLIPSQKREREREMLKYLNSIIWESLECFAEAGSGPISYPTSRCNHSTVRMSSLDAHVVVDPEDAVS
jgi:3,4-dihydroxy-2-butanone 4-phosphate synthase